MLAIENAKRRRGKCTPNVLPCRINHNGPIDASKRYWDPVTTPDGKAVAYFRGRKLHGKQLKLPRGYRGAVLAPTDRVLRQDEPAAPTEDGADVEEVPEVKIIEEQSGFDEIMVWGHEALPDASADPYVRGMAEWIALTAEMHSYDMEESADGEKST